MGVEHLDLLPGEKEAVALGLGLGLHGSEIVTTAALLVGQGQDLLACDQAGKPLLLLALASAQPERLARQEHRGEEGLRREGAAERLEHRDELRHAEVGATQLFGEGDPRPAEVRHLLPEFAGEAGGIGAVSELAHPGDG